MSNLPESQEMTYKTSFLEQSLAYRGSRERENSSNCKKGGIYK